MELVKEIWTDRDILEYRKYIKSLKGSDRDCLWESRIVNTKRECFGGTSTKAREISRLISKGNYLSFLDNIEIINHMDSMVYGSLLAKIKDFTTLRHYLDKMCPYLENWADTDNIKLKCRDYDGIYNLSLLYIKDKREFVRRLGVMLNFYLLRNGIHEHVKYVLDLLKNEDAYYVNMAGAWMLCEYFIRNRDDALSYFENNNTNDFIINKAISKSRDSFRVSKEDKELLLKYKRK